VQHIQLLTRLEYIKIGTEMFLAWAAKRLPETRKLFKNALNLHIYAQTCDSMCLWLRRWGEGTIFMGW